MAVVGLYKRLSTYRQTPWVADYTSDPQHVASAVRGYIAGELPDGLLTVNGSPSARKILVFHRSSVLAVAKTFSNPDGTYRIDDLPVDEEFDVIARDYARVWGDVLAYAIKPLAY